MKPLRIPKIRALDLRSLDVIVAEHNAKPGVLKLRIWRREDFEIDGPFANRMRENLKLRPGLYFDGETLRDRITSRPHKAVNL